MTEELRPCPFCGSAPGTLARPDNIDGTQFYAAVFCHCDGYSATAHAGKRGKTQDEATKAAHAAWNRRAAPSAPSAYMLTGPSAVFKAATSVPSGEPVAWRYDWIGSEHNPHFIVAGKVADGLRLGKPPLLAPDSARTNWTPLYASPQPAPAGWRPIQTAPKDQTVLLYGAKRLEMCVGMNHSQREWVTDTTSEWASMYPPTHWMPLPASPTVKESLTIAAAPAAPGGEG
jgi:Lar family restriction alleviation protein